MRMRKRHNLAPRMEACSAYLIEDPAAMRGEWLAAFPEQDRLYVELGCGKGRFTVETAQAEPTALILAIEKVPDAMVLAMERARDAGITNVRFMDFDAANLADIFAPEEIDRIYLNFSDPWPKSRDAKFRLTAPSFLRLYADALSPGGQIHFKTDNTPLFDWSIGVFRDEGWALSEVTHDLHAGGPVGVMTDYEAKFVAEGMKINRLVAAKAAGTRGTAAGPLPRRRGASLVDARGYAQSAADAAALSLREAALPLCQAFYRRFEHAPELFEDKSAIAPYRYDPEKVETYFADRHKLADRRYYYIMLGSEVIGELVFKKLDPANRRCELGICLVNDDCKNRGFGTAALRMALELGFDALGMETILADSLLPNARSQHVLRKLGFRQTAEDERFRYYRISREEYLDSKGEKRE